MDVNIRVWTEKDVAATAVLERACFAEPWQRESLKESAASVGFYAFALEADGEFVGYICGTTLFEDAELMRVAVLPSMRGRGLGRLLTERFLEDAERRGAEQCFLEVRLSNAAALGLYQSLGFQKNRVRKRYYPDGEDALEMRKVFAKPEQG